MEEMPGNNIDMEQRYCKDCNGETMQEKTLFRQGTGKTKPMYNYKCSRCGKKSWDFCDNGGTT